MSVPFKIVSREGVPFSVVLSGAELLAPIIAQASTAADAASASASAAAASAALLTPYLTAPAPGSPLGRLLQIELFVYAGGVALTWPDNIQVREIAADSLNRMRFRIGAGDTLDGDDAYPQVAIENEIGGFNRPYDGLTSDDQLPLYASDSSLGVPAGTIVGTYRLALDGTPFGTYFPFDVFAYEDGALLRAKALPSEASVANSEGLADIIVSQRAAIGMGQDSPFLDAVSDEYLRRIVEDVYVEGGVPGRTYVLRYRSDNSGGTRRLGFWLYDPIRAAEVAVWTYQAAGDWKNDIPESVYLSGLLQGGVRNDVEYVGLGVTVFLRKEYVEWTHAKTATTATSNAGIRPNRVWSPEEVRRRIKSGQGVRNKEITVGTLGHYATMQVAIDSLIQLGSTPSAVERGHFPYSDKVSVAHQWAITPLAGHTETRAERTISGVGTGMLLWPGLTINATEPNVDISTNPSGTAPLFEANYGGRVLLSASSKLRNLKAGAYVYHIDPTNVAFIPSAANASDPVAGVQHFKLTFLHKGGRLVGNTRVIGRGWIDSQDVTFRDGISEQTGSTGLSGHDLSHTSPNSITPGRTSFINWIMIGGLREVSLIKSHEPTARHELVVDNCDFDAIGVTVDGVAASPPAYQRVGAIMGITYDASLDPS